MSTATYIYWGWGLTTAIIGAASLRGLARFGQLPASLRCLTFFACFEVVIELLTRALINIFHFESNLFLLPLDSIGTVGLLALAYGHALQSAAFSRVMPWGLGIFGSYALANTLAGLGTVRYFPSLQVTNDLLMCSLAVLYFQKLLTELRVVHLRRDPFFWMSAGIAVYTLGDMQLALFGNYMLRHAPSQAQIIAISLGRVFLLFTFYSSCCLALWMRPQK